MDLAFLHREDMLDMEGHATPERRQLLHCFSLSERVAYFECKRAQTERLLQEGCTLFMNTALQDRVIRVAGHKDRLQVRAQTCQHLRQLSSTHSRHREVRNQQVYMLLMLTR